jgi:hypothetical protein
MMSKRLFRQHAYTIETTSRAREGWAWAALAVLVAAGAFACTPVRDEPDSDPDEISMRAYEAGRMAEIDQSKLRAAQSYRKGWEDALRAQGGR